MSTIKKISLTKSADEDFGTVNNDNYLFAVVKEASGGSLSNGDIKHADDVTINVSGSGNSREVTIGNSSDEDAVVRATYSLIHTENLTSKSKNLREYRALRVGKSDATTNFFGTGFDHIFISGIHKTNH